MLGAIAGNIIDSVHEGAGTKHRSFPLFGGGSTMTIPKAFVAPRP